MGISERREREKTERRKAIIASAKELILQHGVENVSIDDIAKKAEFSKSTVYMYFPNKEILFTEICDEAARAFLEHSASFWSADISGMEALKYFWQCYIELFGNSKDILAIFQVRNFIYSSFSLDEQSRTESVNEIIEKIKSIIEKCKSEGVFSPDLDPDTATRLLLSIFSLMVENATQTHKEQNPKTETVTEELSNYFQIMIRGFAKEGTQHSYLNIL